VSTTAKKESIHATVAPDRSAAELIIQPSFAREMLTQQVCVSILQDAGIEINETVAQAVAAIIADPPPDGTEFRQVVARATPPQHGTDGHIEWLASEQNPTQQTDDQEVNHYDRSAYVTVNEGDTVAKVIDPISGRDGRDVLGLDLAAKHGKHVDIIFDDTILRDASGNLIAQIDGILHRDTNRLCIRQRLEISQYVDFSTGNIDFTGDVLIHKGVRDCFIVKATGSIEIKGLIEAATIDSGGDMIADGGMAGRERGFVQVGNNLIGKYLDNVQGQVRGDLEIQREILNSDLNIHGAINSPRARLIAGKVIATGTVELAQIGSGANVKTELILGTVPRLDPTAAELNQIVDQLTLKQQQLIDEQNLIKKNTRRLTPQDQEKLTEISFELHTASANLTKALLTQQALEKKIQEHRTVDLSVHKKIFSGTIVFISDRTFRFTDEIKGPLTIRLDQTKTPVYRQRDADPKELSTITEVRIIDP